MKRTLTALDVLNCIAKLDDATKWLAVVAREVGAEQARRIGWIGEDIAHVRAALIEASCTDVEVESIPISRRDAMAPDHGGNDRDTGTALPAGACRFLASIAKAGA